MKIKGNEVTYNENKTIVVGKYVSIWSSSITAFMESLDEFGTKYWLFYAAGVGKFPGIFSRRILKLSEL